MSAIPQQLEDVTIQLKANIYFEGGVTSHTITSKDGRRRTIGLVRPGNYHFTTEAAEQMDIISGTCRVKLSNENAWISYAAGKTFQVPGDSSFDIIVDSGLTEYLCTFA